MEGTSFDWLNLQGKNSENQRRNDGVNSPHSGLSSPAPPVSFGVNRVNNQTTEAESINRYQTNLSPSFGNHPQDLKNQQFHNQTNSPIPRFNFEDTSKTNQFYKSTSTDQVNSLQAHNSDLKYNSDNTLNRKHRDFFNEANNDSLESFISSDEEDLSIPLSLTAQELTLQESKTYMRWYSDILARTNSRTISLNDVFIFLNNFKISNYIKDKITKLFNKIVTSINIGEFFALLRLISHTILGQEPKRKLIKIKAPIPCPPSILSKKRQNDDVDDDDDNGGINNSASNHGNGIGNNNPEDSNGKPLDLDGFTKFLLTGERPDDPPKKKKSKKLKSVKFSDQVVTDVHDASFVNSPLGSPRHQEIDYSLPMDQLLDRMKNQTQNSQEESEVLKDMESQINHFQNLNSVDSASIGGVPASLHSMHSSEHLLQPNMTGPAQMAHFQTPNYQNEEFLKPNMTGPAQMAQYYNSNTRAENNVSPLQPNVTGPADMAKLFAPPNTNTEHTPTISLQSFTSQMTGNTLANTLQNSVINDGSERRVHSGSFSDRPPPPIPVSRRTRSASSPINSVNEDQLQLPVRNGHTLPPRSSIGNTSTNNPRVPPPPPPSRRRQSSLVNNQPPPQLPPKVEITHNYSNQTFDHTNQFSTQQYPNHSSEQYNTQFTSSSDNINSNQPDFNNGNNSFYANSGSNDSTANILDDLKALQEEVDKIRNMTGGF